MLRSVSGMASFLSCILLAAKGSLYPRLAWNFLSETNIQEHNFLPDHFKKDTFFGTVRPYAGYANFPFPPPPLPPTPLPKELKSKPTTGKEHLVR